MIIYTVEELLAVVGILSAFLTAFTIGFFIVISPRISLCLPQATRQSLASLGIATSLLGTT